ncbi:phage antirepressor KilAC domain-containing protein [Pandoraea nosoerga]|uniref:phage antirepressor KilAC domain-containing protein n=1 Tax=Pandoraea nosoerga TaxID=2508296 RepID=UPI0019802C81|nr:phage antirepressor KilAC domain-containing protein [Pandoraea nosoerga]MBN4665398.1 phage antirepressor KilAC domain-containing protein [Pandoraea nosoerga]MBN4674923.1 phage antirepressor KilAC domain-containing protein [Pandoraea nosoerga]MBN4680239.1 phage antirepressor KilAC domain-containing protein [Pandoraea nosoerga]MBN4744528.1 phage antirepressor KilAC domain-containing protein [Pandoraea nosoerga]
MNELIQVAERQIGDGTIQTVNARDLHAFLEVGKDFSTWIKGRIEQYGFVEHHDFVTFDAAPQNGGAEGFPQNRGKPLGGRPAKEYAISLDMAKELAMVERNDKGKEARLYFIECERRAKANVMDLSTALADPAKLRTVLLAYTEKVMALEAKVQEQAPKAQFHDAVAEAINCQSVQEIAKVLGTGPNRLFKFLRDEGLLMRNNLPYQQHLDAGYFRVVEKQYNDGRGESHTYTRTLVTGKGLAYIQKRLQNQNNFMQEATA